MSEAIISFRSSLLDSSEGKYESKPRSKDSDKERGRGRGRGRGRERGQDRWIQMATGPFCYGTFHPLVDTLFQV